MSADATRPLAGIRVLDLSHVLAGPYASYQLGLMGAEVTRIERLGGDDFVRGHGGTEAMKTARLGASFLSQNMGKRSMQLDLKSPRGRDIYFRLAEQADVVCENFRPGVVDRLGVGFEATRAVNPHVIYASLTGFGPDGPLAGTPAYDHILQGISGMMAMTGTPESGPMRVGFPIVDYVAGQVLVAAVLAALLHRARGHEVAQHIELSMLDALVSLMGPYAVNHETTGALRGLEGNGAFSDSPYSGLFDTREGQIVVTANSPAQAARMRAAIGREDLAEETDAGAVGAALEAAFAADTAEVWEARLSSAGVPAARLRSLAEILAHPQMRQGGLMRPLEVPELGIEVHVPGLPFRHAGWAPPEPTPAPSPGRDTDAILSALGYDEAEIAALRAEGVAG